MAHCAHTIQQIKRMYCRLELRSLSLSAFICRSWYVVKWERRRSAGIEIERAFRGSNGELFRRPHSGRGVNGREMQRRLQRAPQPAPSPRPALRTHSAPRRAASRLRNLPPHSIHSGARLNNRTTGRRPLHCCRRRRPLLLALRLIPPPPLVTALSSSRNG